MRPVRQEQDVRAVRRRAPHDGPVGMASSRKIVVEESDLALRRVPQEHARGQLQPTRRARAVDLDRERRRAAERPGRGRRHWHDELGRVPRPAGVSRGCRIGSGNVRIRRPLRRARRIRLRRAADLAERAPAGVRLGASGLDERARREPLSQDDPAAQTRDALEPDEERIARLELERLTRRDARAVHEAQPASREPAGSANRPVEPRTRPGGLDVEGERPRRDGHPREPAAPRGLTGGDAVHGDERGRGRDAPEDEGGVGGRERRPGGRVDDPDLGGAGRRGRTGRRHHADGGSPAGRAAHQPEGRETQRREPGRRARAGLRRDPLERPDCPHARAPRR
jgi:hypothetical protein